MIKNNKWKYLLVVKVLTKPFARPGSDTTFNTVPGRSPREYVGASAWRGPMWQVCTGSQVLRQYSESCWNSLLANAYSCSFFCLSQSHLREGLFLPSLWTPLPLGAVDLVSLVSVGTWNICSVWALCNSRRSTVWMSDSNSLEGRDVYGEKKGRRHSICSLFL